MGWNFADADDLALFIQAKKFVDKGKRICWDKVAKRTKKDKRQLLERFKWLKKRYGTDLDRFPRRFFAPVALLSAPNRTKPAPITPNRTKSAPSNPNRSKPALSTQVVVTDEHLGGMMQLLEACTRVEVPELTSPTEVAAALATIFGHVPKSAVKHSGSRIDYNTGELSFSGTSKLIELVGPLTSEDIFVDVGSGLGNVVAQVVLQSSVGRAVGIEIREDVALLGLRLMKERVGLYPSLAKVQIIPKDICTADFVHPGTTILYASNKLFRGETNLRLEETICELRSLRVVLLGVNFCPRHRAGCRREFCALWKAEPIELEMTWTCNPVEMFLFTPRFSPNE